MITCCRAFLVILIFNISACTFVDVRREVSYDHHGQLFTDTVLAAIKPESTSAAWVIDNLGEPNSKLRGEDQSEIWVYDIEEQRYHRTRILFVFSYRNRTSVPRQVKIVIKDNTVQRVWKDFS